MVSPTLLRSSAVTLWTSAQTSFLAPGGGGLQTTCQSPYWPLIVPSPACGGSGAVVLGLGSGACGRVAARAAAKCEKMSASSHE